jgi:superfamily I DNA and RNA helicase
MNRNFENNSAEITTNPDSRGNSPAMASAIKTKYLKSGFRNRRNILC